MTASNPLDLLIQEYMPKVEPAQPEVSADALQVTPMDVKGLADLKAPDLLNDKTELIKYRFLCRGGIALLTGPTSVGKSALVMQFAICCGAGKPLFGLAPADAFDMTGMRILLVQSENDEQDLAQMRDGVLQGCEDLTDDEKMRATDNIKVCTVDDKTSDSFASALNDALVRHGPFDLIIVDPAFGFLGGDSNSQKDVSRFMRQLLNPVIHRHHVGLVLVHHTNKPLRGKEKDSWRAGDFAYLGAGSAEWINAARCALAIRAIGSDTIFELRAAKRGRRLGWKDAHGNPTTVQYISHYPGDGIICWQEAKAEDVEELTQDSRKGGRPKQYDERECLYPMQAYPGENTHYYTNWMAGIMGCSKETGRKLILAAIQKGWLKECGDARFRRYQVTDSGLEEIKNYASRYNWAVPLTNNGSK